MTTDLDIKYGLAGVLADESAISKVMEKTNALTYRGYAVQELCRHCSFEEVAYLLLGGELPSTEELAAFKTKERGYREIGETLVSLIRGCRVDAHPMDTLRTSVSFLGVQDGATGDTSLAADHEKAIKLLARIPTIVAADYRFRNGLELVAPRPDLGFAENFFHMCFGEVPEPEVVKCFDISLILYAEHSFNASTFASRVVTSTLSDIYSAVVSGICALKGSLHGGANEAVMHMMLEVGEPSLAHDWVHAALASKRKIMGFGHRVYRNGDSRVPTMTAAFHAMAEHKGGKKWVEMAAAIERTMREEKDIHPNLDFPTGPAYYLMGFDIPMFTPVFVMSRVAGWAAHVMEQAKNNKLIRPLSAYVGPEQRSVAPIGSR